MVLLLIKIKQIFFWDLRKKFMEKKLKVIPSANELKGSTHKIDKKIRKRIFLRNRKGLD